MKREISCEAELAHSNQFFCHLGMERGFENRSSIVSALTADCFAQYSITVRAVPLSFEQWLDLKLFNVDFNSLVRQLHNPTCIQAEIGAGR